MLKAFLIQTTDLVAIARITPGGLSGGQPSPYAFGMGQSSVIPFHFKVDTNGEHPSSKQGAGGKN